MAAKLNKPGSHPELVELIKRFSINLKQLCSGRAACTLTIGNTRQSQNLKKETLQYCLEDNPRL